MSTNLVQGTEAWRQARVGLITGSRVGAVLNLSPFTTRKKVLRDMVDEANGLFSDFDNEPMRWGREHEEEAVKLYEFLYGGNLEVTTTGFHVKGFLGASPDRLVGLNGLVEIKCPYGIREDLSPQFKSIEDKFMKHYWHQVQLQLYVTDREWCDFFQWTPNGYQCERVKRKENWFPLNRDWFRAFMDEYEALLVQASVGGPEDKVGRSARWAAAVEDYRMAAITERAAATEKANARDVLLKLMEEAGIDQCQGAGLKVQKVTRAGSIDYKALAYDQLTPDVVGPLEEQYRKSGSVSYRVDEVKGDE